MEQTIEQTIERQIQTLKAHLAINVRSVGESVEFYRKMLGIEPSKVRTGYAKFDVAHPPLNLTLNEVAFRERGALSHLGIQVASTEDVAAMRKKWAAAGLVTRDEMQTNCCYALQDKTWVHDPDGNEWEVFVVLEDNLAETSVCCGIGEADAAVEASACATSTTAEAASVSATTNAAAPSCCANAAAAVPVAIARRM